MACNCAERRKAIVEAVKNPSTALTATRFVVKTGAQDIANGLRRATAVVRKKGSK